MKYVHNLEPSCCKTLLNLNCHAHLAVVHDNKHCFLTFPPGAAGVEVTVTGREFDGATKENNVVKIGNITCAVSSATDTEIKCTAGMGPAGPRTVWVSVIGKGAVKVDDSKSPFEPNGS